MTILSLLYFTFAVFFFLWQNNPIEDDYIVDWNRRLGSGISGPVRYVCVYQCQMP